MHVDLIVPAYNEVDNLERMVERTTSVLSSEADDWTFGILLVVSDGSTDGTQEIADRLREEYLSVSTLVRTENPGFGNAIADGLGHANGDVLIPFMADLSDDPRDVPKMVEAIRDGYDVVYGSRFVDGGSVEGYPPLKLLYNRSFNNLIRLMFGIRARDVTNAFTAYRSEVIEDIGIDSITSESFDITAELPLRAHILGFRSIEVPVSWHGREAGVSKLNATRKGPLYIKRVFEQFLLGNAVGLRDLFRSITSQSKARILGAGLIGIFILIALFSLTGFVEVFDIVSEASPVWIGAAIVSYTVSFVFRTWRWRVLLRTAGHLATRGGVFRCIMFGWFLNFILPARVGDLARGFALKTTEGVPFSVGTGTVVIERALDMLVLGATIILVGTLVLGGGETTLIAAGALAIASALVVVLAVVFLLPDRLLERVGAVSSRVKKGLVTFSTALRRTVQNPAAVLLAFLLSLPVWLFEVGTIFFSARAVGVEISGIVTVLTATTAFVAQSLPLTPAGLGTFEATITGTLAVFGVDQSAATALALVDHFGRIAIVTVLGAVSAVHIGFRSRLYFREDSEQDPPVDGSDRM